MEQAQLKIKAQLKAQAQLQAQAQLPEDDGLPINPHYRSRHTHVNHFWNIGTESTESTNISNINNTQFVTQKNNIRKALATGMLAVGSTGQDIVQNLFNSMSRNIDDKLIGTAAEHIPIIEQNIDDILAIDRLISYTSAGALIFVGRLMPNPNPQIGSTNPSERHKEVVIKISRWIGDEIQMTQKLHRYMKQRYKERENLLENIDKIVATQPFVNMGYNKHQELVIPIDMYNKFTTVLDEYRKHKKHIHAVYPNIIYPNWNTGLKKLCDDIDVNEKTYFKKLHDNPGNEKLSTIPYEYKVCKKLNRLHNLCPHFVQTYGCFATKTNIISQVGYNIYNYSNFEKSQIEDNEVIQREVEAAKHALPIPMKLYDDSGSYKYVMISQYITNRGTIDEYLENLANNVIRKYENITKYTAKQLHDVTNDIKAVVSRIFNLIVQIAAALDIAQENESFVEYDLHGGNVLINSSSISATYHYIFHVMDPTTNRITKQRLSIPCTRNISILDYEYSYIGDNNPITPINSSIGSAETGEVHMQTLREEEYKRKIQQSMNPTRFDPNYDICRIIIYIYINLIEHFEIDGTMLQIITDILGEYTPNISEESCFTLGDHLSYLLGFDFTKNFKLPNYTEESKLARLYKRPLDWIRLIKRLNLTTFNDSVAPLHRAGIASDTTIKNYVWNDPTYKFINDADIINPNQEKILNHLIDDMNSKEKKMYKLGALLQHMKQELKLQTTSLESVYNLQHI
jgi:hypothetical protein